jgi:hypothetical protein
MFLRSFVLPLSVLLLFTSCAGYHLGPVKPTPMRSVERLSVSAFKNDTLEPRLEVLMANALLKQLHQDGTYRITAERDAQVLVDGTVLRVERTPARSAKSDYYQTSEFILSLVARVRATDKASGKILLDREIAGNSTFFVSGKNLRIADVNRDERQALPLAAQDLATQITSYLSEGW